MSAAAVLRERIARHGLVERTSATVRDAAARTVAIQAQDPAASRLGIRVRTRTTTESDVVEAIERDRSVTRTWLMRGTIHLVDTADVRWLVRLFEEPLRARYRSRWRQLGLTEAVLEHTASLLPDVLAARPLTRPEIRDALAQRGVRVDADPQAVAHTLLHASVIGLICRGHDRGRDATFTVLGDWVRDAPAGPSGDDALAELTRRYFAAFSPATPADFTTWSGLGAGRAIELIRDQLTPADVDGRPGFRLGSVEPARGVALLPAFDNYLLGYRYREAILAAPRRDRVYLGGMIRPSVVLDGRVVGTWSAARARDPVRVSVTPFEPLARRALRGVEAEVADLARFFDRPTELDLAPAAD